MPKYFITPNYSTNDDWEWVGPCVILSSVIWIPLLILLFELLEKKYILYLSQF
jgi:hypothetical protein